MQFCTSTLVTFAPSDDAPVHNIEEYPCTFCGTLSKIRLGFENPLCRRSKSPELSNSVNARECLNDCNVNLVQGWQSDRAHTHVQPYQPSCFSAKVSRDQVGACRAILPCELTQRSAEIVHRADTAAMAFLLSSIRMAVSFPFFLNSLMQMTILPCKNDAHLLSNGLPYPKIKS